MPRTAQVRVRVRERTTLALALLAGGLCPRMARAAPERPAPPPSVEAQADLGEDPGETGPVEAEPVEAEPVEAEPLESVSAEGEAPVSESPPRVSGTYFGMTIWPGLSWSYSPNLDFDQSAVLSGGGGSLRLGQAVFPWMTIGVDAGGGFYFSRDTFFSKGGLLIELGFYPVPRYPFSIRGGFGFGAGLIIDDRSEDFGGVGGPRFMGALRYEFFPNAERKRPKRPGGWVVGPELGWRGFTPAAKGRPMSNTLLLGVWFGYYWGK